MPVKITIQIDDFKYSTKADLFDWERLSNDEALYEELKLAIEHAHYKYTRRHEEPITGYVIISSPYGNGDYKGIPVNDAHAYDTREEAQSKADEHNQSDPQNHPWRVLEVKNGLYTGH